MRSLEFVRGKLRDTVLDWEDSLPAKELEKSEYHSRYVLFLPLFSFMNHWCYRLSDLSICLGTTLQIVPAGKLPLLAKKNGGKLVLCNLQPTRYVSIHLHVMFESCTHCVDTKSTKLHFHGTYLDCSIVSG